MIDGDSKQSPKWINQKERWKMRPTETEILKINGKKANRNFTNANQCGK